MNGTMMMLSTQLMSGEKSYMCEVGEDKCFEDSNI